MVAAGYDLRCGIGSENTPPHPVRISALDYADSCWETLSKDAEECPSCGAEDVACYEL